MNHSDSAPRWRRRSLLGAASVAAGGALVGTGIGIGTGTAPAAADPVPPDAMPGGAYDRYIAGLAAEDRFSGVVMLVHRGRTVLSRSYGMADRERGIRNHEGVAVNLGSAVKPFVAVAVLQLAQRGHLRLHDVVGDFLDGFPADVAAQVTIHHLLTDTSGLSHPEQDLQRVFHSREEVHAHYEQWSRQVSLVGVPGTDSGTSGACLAIAAQIVEAVTGVTYWDYVTEHVFDRCGMTGTGFFTRPEWLSDPHIAHSYMIQHDGTRVDAVRNLDKGGVNPFEPGKNPGRNFIDHAGDGGFATAPDLVRFARALGEGTVLDQPYADLLTGAKMPQNSGKHGGPPPAHPAFKGYTVPVKILQGQWVTGRGGVNPGSTANWNLYQGSGWIGVLLSNYDNLPVQEILDRERLAVLGPAD